MTDMATPHLVRLATVENRGIITACRHGAIHLSWDNLTLRLGFQDLNRLARLFRLSSTLALPHPLYANEYGIAADKSGYRVVFGEVELLVSAADFLSLADMIRTGWRRLEQLLAAGEWPQTELLAPEESVAPADRFSLS